MSTMHTRTVRMRSVTDAPKLNRYVHDRQKNRHNAVA